MILVNIYVKTFKTDIIVFHVFDVTLTDNFQYQGQFIDTVNITRRDQRKHIQISNKTNSIQITSSMRLTP